MGATHPPFHSKLETGVFKVSCAPDPTYPIPPILLHLGTVRSLGLLHRDCIVHCTGTSLWVAFIPTQAKPRWN